MIRIIPLLLLSSCFIARGQIAFEENGKFGFKSEQKVIIEPQYDYASDFIEGLACVKKNNKWGYITPNNNWVSKEYDRIQPFNHGIGKVLLNGKIGLVDSSGAEIIPPLYDEIKIRSANNFELINNGLIGLKSPTIDIPCLYTKVGQYHADYGFGKNEDGTYDIYDKNGLILEKQDHYVSKWNIDPNFNFIGIKNEKYGVFNLRDLKWRITPKYEYIVQLDITIKTNNTEKTYHLFALFIEFNEARKYSSLSETKEVNMIEIRSLTDRKIKIKNVTGYEVSNDYNDFNLSFSNSDENKILSELIIDILGL